MKCQLPIFHLGELYTITHDGPTILRIVHFSASNSVEQHLSFDELPEEVVLKLIQRMEEND